MAKGVRKLTGFLWALLIAVVSFFVIFIFFPDVSNRFFGVSVRGEDVQKVVKDIGDSVSGAVEKVSDTVVEAVTEKAPQLVESATQSVSESLKKSSSQSK